MAGLGSGFRRVGHALCSDPPFLQRANANGGLENKMRVWVRVRVRAHQDCALLRSHCIIIALRWNGPLCLSLYLSLSLHCEGMAA